MFFYVWMSFSLLHIFYFYVLLFWTSHKDVVRVWEKARGDTNCLSQIPSEKKRNKTGISGCSLFVVPCFQPATSIDHLYIYSPTSVWNSMQQRIIGCIDQNEEEKRKEKKAQGICLKFFLADVWFSYVLPFFFHCDSVDTSIIQELTVQWLILPCCVLHSV